MRRLLMVITFLVLLNSSARADLITYTWNDDFTNSGFYGTFTVNTQGLITVGATPNVLTNAAIFSSSFQYLIRPYNSFGPVYFSVSGVSAGGIPINPTTGAVLGSGEIFFGPSSFIYTPTPQQFFSARAQFDTNYAVSLGFGFGGGQSVYGSTTVRPSEYFMSTGHWDVSVQRMSNPIPAPPGLLLLGFALVGYFVRRQL